MADALTAVTATVLILGPMLAIQWMSMKLKLWLQDADGGGWHCLFVYGSLLQGGLDGHPVFFLVIGVMILKIRHDGRISAQWHELLVWIYVDDLLFQCQRRRSSQALL